MSASTLRATSRAASLLCALCLLGPWACASSVSTLAASPTSPFEDVDHVLFDNGIDFVEDPAALSGSWRADIERELRQRITRSDVVAQIRVDTVVVERDPEGAKKLVLSTAVGEKWRGVIDEELPLSVGPSQPGYAALDRAQPRLLEGQFVLFLKWAEDASGKVVARFHLAPASEPVVEAVKAALGKDSNRVIRITR